MISDDRLDRESPEDIPVVLAWDLVDRMNSRFRHEQDLRRHAALKGVSEFAYYAVKVGMVETEPMALQLEAMASDVRNMKGSAA